MQAAKASAQIAMDFDKAAAKDRRKYDAIYDECARWDKEIRRLLGEYSAFRFRTPQMQAEWDQMARVLVAQERTSFVPTRYPSIADPGDIVPLSQTLMHYTCNLFEVSLEHDPHAFQSIIRFEAVNRSGKVAYAMSDNMLHQHDFGERDVHWLAYRIAHEMLSGKAGDHLRGVSHGKVAY
jgi:hypothetical protein